MTSKTNVLWTLSLLVAAGTAAVAQEGGGVSVEELCRPESGETAERYARLCAERAQAADSDKPSWEAAILSLYKRLHRLEGETRVAPPTSSGPSPTPAALQPEAGPPELVEAGYQCADTVSGWECPDLGRLIAQGGTVDLPKGIYRQCAVIERPVTILGNGAHLQGTACQGKGALVASADTVIRNLECSGIAVRDGNGACVRQQTANVTVEAVHFHDSQEGVLVDGRGRSLRVTNSRFERLGGDCRIRCGRAHGIYYSSNRGQLYIENSSFRAPRDQGHLVKSGAPRLEIVSSTLDETNGNGSRLIDAYNGGVLILRDVTLINARGGNRNLIGFDYGARIDHPANEIRLENVSAACENGALVAGRNSFDATQVLKIGGSYSDCR